MRKQRHRERVIPLHEGGHPVKPGTSAFAFPFTCTCLPAPHPAVPYPQSEHGGGTSAFRDGTSAPPCLAPVASTLTFSTAS